MDADGQRADESTNDGSQSATPQPQPMLGTADVVPPRAQVYLVDPERMNLLGLLIRNFLERQLESPRVQKKAKRLRGNFGLRAGRMAITLSCSRDGIAIVRGLLPKTRARVFGPMHEMVELVTAGGGLIGAGVAVLEGRIGIRGNPFALLRLLPIMTGTPSPNPGVRR